MIMVEAEILEALQVATRQAVAASIMPALPIKYLGRTFTIPNDDRYLEIVYIPNNLTNEFWDDCKTYRGLFRLILNWGMDDAGAYEPLHVIGSIASYFPKGSLFQNGSVAVRVYEEPGLTGVIETAPNQLFPVTIRYMFFQH